MRVLIARRAATGLLLPRMAVGAQTCAAFAAAVAAEMGLAPSSIEPEVIEAVDDVVASRVGTRLAAGIASTAAVFWPDGDQDGDFVASGAEVDAVTEARARRLYGSAAAEAEHRRAYARHAWATAHGVGADGRAVNAAEKADADGFLRRARAVEHGAARIRAEGEAFKDQHGF